MTPKTSRKKTSRNMPAPPPRNDSARDTQQAVIDDADKTESNDRDLVHGEGGSIGIPARPVDLSKDD
ncbi:hypothetical protein ACFQZO_27600 [Bradyrhizobium sp. GCM10027634]|uniref:hypothetical protein n=1 Tax=unclassified Bradyrhizobium TaxID=2631580 RepID=UPI00188AE972|nr:MULTISPECIES: hypothetical protein [unclassified Bradyrhizobium]MDN5004619.1 hypothetical protein [Bradyrhizobium sp. WYCCWR 12677]QOZ43929.1 hypothetical protein XH89_10850 [Bradyrhizobium sp. CCBAU 53340]